MSLENGAFGAYLIGTYEAGRLGVGTILHIINPTTQPLEVIVAFFDDDENLETCKKFHGNDQLTPNEMKEIFIPLQVPGLKPKNGFGVMKIIIEKIDLTSMQSQVGEKYAIAKKKQKVKFH